jgi:DNA-binding HxlR family transcriptional regulator
MEEPIIEKREGCIKQALEIIGNKWTALIIRELTTGCKRFSELQKAMPGISAWTTLRPSVLL